jgi:hypothetical protein
VLHILIEYKKNPLKKAGFFQLNFGSAINFGMIAFTYADIGSAEFPTTPGTLGACIFDIRNRLIANRAKYFIFLFAGFIREALFLGHR